MLYKVHKKTFKMTFFFQLLKVLLHFHLKAKMFYIMKWLKKIIAG